MTIVECNDKLLNWFSNNETFSFKDNYKDITTEHITLSPEADRAAFEIGLRELEKLGFIKSFELKKEIYWILVKPFSMYDRNISLSYSTCLILSDIAKQYAVQFNNKDLLIDPTQITEREILKIVGVLVQTLKSGIEDNQIDNQINNDIEKPENN